MKICAEEISLFNAQSRFAGMSDDDGKCCEQLFEFCQRRGRVVWLAVWTRAAVVVGEGVPAVN